MTSLERKQGILAHLVRLVARKVSHGLFVAGPGGLGKSRVIAETLSQEKIKPILVNSHITALSLYRTLHDYWEGAVLWLDDCDSIYSNLRILGLLRSALWGQGDRIVTYSSSQLNDIPNSFVFDSHIIMCANSLPGPRNEAFNAVLGRVDVFQLEASNVEIIEQMQKLGEAGHGELSPGKCKEVVDFIENQGGSRTLSMRLYEPSLRKVEYCLTNGIDWKPLIAAQLDQLGRRATSEADHHECMTEVLAACSSPRQQEEQWCRATGKSRASFFRIKKQFEGHT